MPADPQNGPDSKVKALKEELQATQVQAQNSQLQLENSKKKMEKLQADIAELEKLAKEINEASDAYKDAYGDIIKSKNDIQEYYDDKEKAINATTTKDDREKVDDLMDKIDTEKIKEWQDKIAQLEGSGNDSVKSAENAYNKTLKELKSHEKGYEGLKNLRKNVDENYKKIRNLRNTIEEEENKGNKLIMYSLIKDYSVCMEETKSMIRENDKYKEELYVAWDTIENKKKDLRSKFAILKERKDELDKTKKDLESITKNRRKEILDNISKL